MRGFANSAVATLFVLVVLLVVPILAVVGIPDFHPIVASSSPAMTDPEPRSTVEDRVGQSARFVPNDLFAPFDESPSPDLTAAFDTSRARPGQPSIEPRFAGGGSLDESWDVDERGRVVRRSRPQRGAFAEGESVPVTRTGVSAPNSRASQPTGRTDSSPRTASTDTTPLGLDEVTWQSAVARLNQLGIHDYSLNAGRVQGEFHFTCVYSTDEDARIVRRFEAEAPEPLLAVRRVLLQIDEWNARRR